MKPQDSQLSERGWSIVASSPQAGQKRERASCGLRSGSWATAAGYPASPGW